MKTSNSKTEALERAFNARLRRQSTVFVLVAMLMALLTYTFIIMSLQYGKCRFCEKSFQDVTRHEMYECSKR